jgi:anti-sigma-K factor RskA
MICQGLQGNTYDLYVLGLLGEPERSELDNHIRTQCPACIRGVQRSMRLWVVFTSSLKDAEPSADFEQRLLRVVDLSKSVLTFPKDAALAEPIRRTRPISVALAAALSGVLAVSGWFAGHTSSRLDRQNLMNQLVEQSQELASAQLALQTLRESNAQMPTGPKPPGNPTASADALRLSRRLSEADAATNQYKSLLERQQHALDNRTDILNLLSAPGARLLALKAAAQFQGIGYAVLVPNQRIALICSNVAELPRGREYQLWILRGSESTPANAGVFAPDHGGKSYVQIDDASVVKEISGLAVTDEPAGGSRVPTGSKLLTWNCEQGDVAHCSSE